LPQASIKPQRILSENPARNRLGSPGLMRRLGESDVTDSTSTYKNSRSFDCSFANTDSTAKGNHGIRGRPFLIGGILPLSDATTSPICVEWTEDITGADQAQRSSRC